MFENLDTAVTSAVIVVIGFLFQLGFFVKPVDLEKKHREIIKDAALIFASKETVEGLKTDVHDIKDKIDQIYNFLLKKGE